MSKYSERFWKQNWDEGLEDLDPIIWEKTLPEAFQDTFEKFPDKVALSFQGLEIPFSEIGLRANQFANMLIDNGFKKPGESPGFFIVLNRIHRISGYAGYLFGCFVC